MSFITLVQKNTNSDGDIVTLPEELSKGWLYNGKRYSKLSETGYVPGTTIYLYSKEYDFFPSDEGHFVLNYKGVEEELGEDAYKSHFAYMSRTDGSLVLVLRDRKVEIYENGFNGMVNIDYLTNKYISLP